MGFNVQVALLEPLNDGWADHLDPTLKVQAFFGTSQIHSFAFVTLCITRWDKWSISRQKQTSTTELLSEFQLIMIVHLVGQEVQVHQHWVPQTEKVNAGKFNPTKKLAAHNQ